MRMLVTSQGNMDGVGGDDGRKGSFGCCSPLEHQNTLNGTATGLEMTRRPSSLVKLQYGCFNAHSSFSSPSPWSLSGAISALLSSDMLV